MHLPQLPLTLVILPLATLTILNLLFLHAISTQYAFVTALLAQPPRSGDLLRHLPSHQVLLKFKVDDMPITSEDIWSHLIPENGGVITKEGPDNTANGNKYVVGMYQQLRCLDDLRIAYLAVHNRAILGRIPNATAAEICLGQLWQIIQCNADITLDGASLLEQNGTRVPGSTGADVEHRCNDWTRIRDIVEQGASVV